MPELARRRHSRLAEALLGELAPVEALEFGIASDGVQRRLAPEKPQEWVPLFTERPEPLTRSPLEYSLGMIPT